MSNGMRNRRRRSGRFARDVVDAGKHPMDPGSSGSPTDVVLLITGTIERLADHAAMVARNRNQVDDRFAGLT